MARNIGKKTTRKKGKGNIFASLVRFPPYITTGKTTVGMWVTSLSVSEAKDAVGESSHGTRDGMLSMTSFSSEVL